MTSTQFRPAATTYPLSFDTVANSLSSRKTSTRLESIKSKLFAENTRGGVSRTRLQGPQADPKLTWAVHQSPLTNRQLSISFPFVFSTLQIPFPATPFFSHPYKLPGGVGSTATSLMTFRRSDFRTFRLPGCYTISRPTSPSCFEPERPTHTTLHRIALSGSSFKMSSTTCPRRSRKSTWRRNPPCALSTTRQGILFWLRPRFSCVMTRLAGFFEAIRFARRDSGRGEVGIV
jgi:hypothetical protein